MTRLLRIKMAVAGVLGSYCARCGMCVFWPHDTRRPSGAKPADCLQVGHPNGRKWSIRRLKTIDRWRRYLKGAIAGKVQAECGPCNRRHGGSIRYQGRKDKTRQGAKRK